MPPTDLDYRSSSINDEVNLAVMHAGLTRHTYPGITPFMHLDHIYYDPEFESREMHSIARR
jgi:endonuclease/exonuclease/phosphatase family metal-dependent hydrolase